MQLLVHGAGAAGLQLRGYVRLLRTSRRSPCWRSADPSLQRPETHVNPCNV